MKKKTFFLSFIILLSIAILLNVGSKITSTPKQELKIEDAENIITNYLIALSNKDYTEMKKLTTEEYSKNITEDGIVYLNSVLIEAKLISLQLRNKTDSNTIFDSKVKIICYDNASETGDWIPGESVSTKSFELKYVNNQWKINGWGVY